MAGYLKNLASAVLGRKQQPVKRGRTNGYRRRAYQAAEVSRLTNDWPYSSSSPNDELYTALAKVRARARHLEQNNEYASRYLQLMGDNVVGASGVNIQVRAKNPDNTNDDFANNYIETALKAWGRKGVCTVCGSLSFIDVQRMIIEAVHGPGEILVRKRTGVKNGFGFALELLEADQLNEEYNATRPNGNKVVMGVERDANNRAVAYWVSPEHPGGYLYRTSTRDLERVPANEILLLGLPERPGQARFISPMVTGMYRAQMLNGYEEAELVAARTSSAKMGFFTSEDGEEYTGDDIEGTDDDHDVITEADPGTFEMLPNGVNFTPWDPTHPTTAYEPFIKIGLRALASAWGVSYVSLANDLNGVNYSSIRQGELEQRNTYRARQTWLIEHFLKNIFEEWLLNFLTQPETVLNPARFWKFNAPVFKPRGWAWVDPLKEIQANHKAIKEGTKNISEVLGEQGLDYEDFLKTRKSDIELAEKYKIKLELITPEPAGGNTNG